MASTVCTMGASPWGSPKRLGARGQTKGHFPLETILYADCQMLHIFLDHAWGSGMMLLLQATKVIQCKLAIHFR